MWFFDLIIIALLFFVSYQIISRRIVKGTGMQDLVKKYREEINNVTVGFNKTAYDNVSMLEAKIQEAQAMLTHLEKKCEEYRKVIGEYGEAKKKHEARQQTETQEQIRGRLTKMLEQENVNVDPAALAGSAKDKEKKARRKQTVILAYIDEGKSVQEIADKLDISQEEVKYYLKKENQL